MDSSPESLLRIHVVSILLTGLAPFVANDSYAHALEGLQVSLSSLDFKFLMFFEWGREVIKVYFGKLIWQCDTGQMEEKEIQRPVKKWWI